MEVAEGVSRWLTGYADCGVGSSRRCLRPGMRNCGGAARGGLLDRRTLGLRGFDAAGMLKGALLAMPGEADGGSGSCSADPEIASIHAHNAAHGCFLARVERTDGNAQRPSGLEHRRGLGLGAGFGAGPDGGRAVRGGRADDRHLLPPVLRGAASEAGECALLPIRRGGGGDGAAGVPQVQAGRGEPGGGGAGAGLPDAGGGGGAAFAGGAGRGGGLFAAPFPPAVQAGDGGHAGRLCAGKRARAWRGAWAGRTG
jgi:hypothetical protein